MRTRHLLPVVLVVTAACAGLSTPTPVTEEPPPGELIDADFAFLVGSDDVSRAMKSLWEHGLQAPETPEEMSAAMAARAEAIETIERNLPAVQVELLRALETIEGDDVGRYITLVPLIRIAGDWRPILTHLQDIAMAELSDAEREVAHEPTDAELMRGLAMEMLAHQAQNGSELARRHVLSAVASPAPYVRADAVQHYYQITSDRRRAQREMRELMRPEDRHLLYLY